MISKWEQLKSPILYSTLVGNPIPKIRAEIIQRISPIKREPPESTVIKLEIRSPKPVNWIVPIIIPAHAHADTTGSALFTASSTVPSKPCDSFNIEFLLNNPYHNQ